MAKPGLWERCIIAEAKVTELQKDLEQLKDINQLQAFASDLERTPRSEANVTSSLLATASLLPIIALGGTESTQV